MAASQDDVWRDGCLTVWCWDRLEQGSWGGSSSEGGEMIVVLDIGA